MTQPARLRRGSARAALWVIALVAVMTAAAAAGPSRTVTAGFSASVVNSANSLTAGNWGALRSAAGTYTGDGAAHRSLTGIAFQPDVVIVASTGPSVGTVAVLRTATMPAGLSKPLGPSALAGDLIVSLDPGGFSVGGDSRVNAAGENYQWVAMRAGSASMAVGTYVGAGGGTTVTGVGFGPDAVVVVPEDTAEVDARLAGMTRSYHLVADAGGTNRITSLGADGFTLGNSPAVGGNGKTYHYVAWNVTSGLVSVLGWTGDATAGRAVTGAGFAPGFVLARSDGSSAARWRTSSFPGGASLGVDGTGLLADGITGLGADGFVVGSGAAVNAASTSYVALALRVTG